METSLKAKLSTAFVAVAVAALAIAGFLVDRTVTAAMTKAYQDRLSYQTTMFGQMTANALFGDIDPNDTSLRDSVKALGANVRTRLALIAKDGTVVADSDADPKALGSQADAPEIAAAAAQGTGTSIRDGSMWVASTIVRDGATLGFARTSVPMQEVLSYVSAVRRRVALGSLAALVAATLLGLIVSSGIVKPIRALHAGAKRVGAGDFAHAIEVRSKDELGELAQAFNEMTRNLGATMARLDARNRDMRLVLDNVDQGLLMVDRAGIASTERSAAVERWFGPPKPGERFSDLLSRADEAVAIRFAMQFEELLEEFLPRELLLYQLPSHLEQGDKHFDLSYRPITDAEDRIAQLLVVISDVSAKRAAERAEAEQREIAAIFEQILRDKSGVLEFLLDAESLVCELAADERMPLSDVKRKLHTLKGNSAMFGMNSLSALCHGYESAMEERGDDLLEDERKGLAAAWTRTAARLSVFVGDDKQSIVIDDGEYAAVLQSLLEGAPRTEVVRQMRQWRMERASDRLDRFAQQVRDLAKRLDKGDVRVELETDGLRLPRQEWTQFWSVFGHAVRNAVDHGLESPELRVAAGKPEHGTIRFAAEQRGRDVWVSLADDGRGIDWAKIAERARDAGLPADRQEDLVAAVFADGLSTNDDASEVSGRGVGLGALKQACEHLGGCITIESIQGKGTTFRFRMPIPERGQSLRPQAETVRPQQVGVQIGAEDGPRPWDLANSSDESPREYLGG